MAIIIRGKSKCSLCGAIIQEGQEVVAFPPFVPNELDPLWIFNDGAFHADCFYSHPLASKAQTRYKEIKAHTGPGNRLCAVCKKQIKDPDEYFTLGHLTGDESHPLYSYNYMQAHQSCLPEWPELPYLYEQVEKLMHSGTWEGRALERLLADLIRAVTLGSQ
jgi:hypothetical protein